MKIYSAFKFLSLLLVPVLSVIDAQAQVSRLDRRFNIKRSQPTQRQVVRKSQVKATPRRSTRGTQATPQKARKVTSHPTSAGSRALPGLMTVLSPKYKGSPVFSYENGGGNKIKYRYTLASIPSGHSLLLSNEEIIVTNENKTSEVNSSYYLENYISLWDSRTLTYKESIIEKNLGEMHDVGFKYDFHKKQFFMGGFNDYRDVAYMDYCYAYDLRTHAFEAKRIKRADPGSCFVHTGITESTFRTGFENNSFPSVLKLNVGNENISLDRRDDLVKLPVMADLAGKFRSQREGEDIMFKKIDFDSLSLNNEPIVQRESEIGTLSKDAVKAELAKYKDVECEFLDATYWLIFPSRYGSAYNAVTGGRYVVGGEYVEDPTDEVYVYNTANRKLSKAPSVVKEAKKEHPEASCYFCFGASDCGRVTVNACSVFRHGGDWFGPRVLAYSPSGEGDIVFNGDRADGGYGERKKLQVAYRISTSPWAMVKGGYYRTTGSYVASLFSIWNKVPNHPGKSYWIAGEYGHCQLFLMDDTRGTGKCVHQWEGSWNRDSAKPTWLPDRRWLCLPVVANCWDIYEVDETFESVKKLCSVYLGRGDKYAIVLPDGKYAGTPGCEDFLFTEDAGGRISMQALAPWRNKPAEVLEAIGGNADDIASLKETTKRWLRKQGFDPDNMPAEPAIKDFPAVEVQMPSLFNADGTARFTVTAKATANDIAKVIVRADGTEIPQNWDSDLSVPAGGQKELAVEVPLASGQNWIEVTPVDSKGIAGDTFRFRTIYKGSDRSDLYIIALGVSDYDNPDLQLQYAAKDAADISAALKKYGAGNEKLVLLLTDKQVKDRDVLDKIREFLSTTTINDRVVLYVAGHGMLDDKYDYYYAPAGFDPERIAETGITMDELTGCLQGSKARKRLLLLDTCHSGMLGEEGEEKLAMSGVQLPHGVRAIQHRGMKVQKNIGALNTNQKKRYIEDLFSRGDIQRGINIIAGAAGAEYALESGEWKNGVFTASAIGAMRGEGAAQDTDGDGFFSVEELQQKIASAVQQQTGGQQRPSIVSTEGAENMVLTEGVGYYKIKQLMTQKDWSRLADVIRESPRNYDEGQSEGLVSEAIEANAPVATIRQLLEHGASPKRKLGRVLGNFLGSTNSEYIAHRPEMAKLFARSGDIKDLKDFVYPYNKKNSLKLFEIFASHGIDVNCDTHVESDMARRLLGDILRIKYQRKYMRDPAELRRQIEKLALDTYTWYGMSVLHELAFLYCEAVSDPQKSDILSKMRVLLEHGADPNRMQGHVSDVVYPDATDVTPLYILCRNGRISFQDALPAIKLLIQHGANIHLSDCNGQEPLDTSNPNYWVLEQLAAAAKSGASMDNIQAVSTAVPNSPAPSYPVSGGDRSDLQPMINRMAALRCREASSALYQKRLLALLPLIRDGADVNLTLPETKGNTALHYSCAIGSWSITQWLVNHGADVNAVTDKGATPLDCVGSDNGKRIRALLKSRGAKHASEL